MTNAELIKALRNCSCIKNEDHCKICGYRHITECGRRIADDAADALEAADKRIAELMPKEGEWVESEDLESVLKGKVVCSICGEPEFALIITNEFVRIKNSKSRYCPNCGARMRGEHDEQIH